MSNDNVNEQGTFQAELLKVSGLSPLKVSDFIKDLPPCPGNVGVCLSGGGSRAMTAGMGQLRALKLLSNGSGNLLSQTKAISTVSGGSWVGTTFSYINNPNCSDDDYLGKYIPPNQLRKEDFTNLDEKNIGYRCTKDFSIAHLFFQAIGLLIGGLPPDMVWQTMIGHHIMQYYNLFSHGPKDKPNSFFTYNTETRNAINQTNPALAKEEAYLIPAGGNRVRRPYLVCNMSMFVNTTGTDFKYLVPVQATPFFTGIVSTLSNVTDNNNRVPGGGEVTSFGFSSNLISLPSEKQASVNQDRQFALADAVGTSSAAFAEALKNLATQYEDHLDQLVADMKNHYDNIEKNAKPHLSSEKSNKLDLFLDKFKRFNLEHDALKLAEKFEPMLEKAGIDIDKDLKGVLDLIKKIVPAYKYWPVLNTTPNPNVNPTGFADAGSLENTAVSAMLAYSDIDNIIAFVNTSTPLQTADKGVFNANGQEIPNTRIEVDSQLPPLFGYQPYDKKKGYVLYQNAGDPKDPIFKNNQVFDSACFPELLQNLWNNMGSGDTSIKHYGSNYLQSLTTLDNAWFGVKGNRKVKVLWVYNGNFSAWMNALPQDAKDIVADIKSFPYYNTFLELELNNQKVNALAHLTSWNIAENIKDEVLKMYQ